MANTRRRKKQADLRANQVQVVEPRVMLAATVWVDDNPVNPTGTLGSQSNPYTSIGAAAIAINNLGAGAAGSTINIRSGVYRETVDLSGLANLNGVSATAPTKFVAYDGAGTVTIKGTNVVGTTGTTGFSLVSGQSYYSTTALPSMGDGKDQIFVDGQMYQWARWPFDTVANTSLSPMTKSSDNARWATFDTVSMVNLANGMRRITITDAAITNAQNWVGGTINLLPGHSWVSETATILAGSTGGTLIFDLAQTGEIDNPDNVYLPKEGDRYYLTGLLQGLQSDSNSANGNDSFGEWFRNSSGVLYVGAAAGKVVEAKQRSVAINLQNRKFITFDGINVFGANIISGKTAGSPVESEGLVLKNMKIEYASHYDKTANYPTWSVGVDDTGVVLDGKNHTIQNSTIQYSAGNGITLKGSGHRIINNKIFDTNYMATDAAPIYAGTAATRVERVEIAYNTIQRAGRGGIIPRGIKASSIHHNDISEVLLMTGDGGAIHSYMDDGEGTVIAYNKIHDIYAEGSSGSGLISVGLYLDNGCSNFVLHHNVVWNVKYAMILNTFNNPQYHRVFQNTLVGDIDALNSWGPESGPGTDYPNDPVNTYYNMTGTELRNNLMVGGVRLVPTANVASIVLPSNLRFENRSSLPGNVLSNLAGNDLTLTAGSIAGEFGETVNDVSPYTFGFTGSKPAAGALDVGQQMFLAGWQSSSLPFNNGLTGKSIKPGVTTILSGEYDTLGEGVSYHDATAVNSLAADNWRRGEGVDANGSQVGYISADEYLRYTINVEVAGDYKLTFATNVLAGQTFQVFLEKPGVSPALLGTVTTVIGNTTPLTVNFGLGSQVLRIVSVGSGYGFSNLTLESVQKPYGTLTTVSPAGTTSIPVGSYDMGGQGVSFSDTTTGNSGSTHRVAEGTGVDGTSTSITADNTEWVEYSFNVAQAGQYKVTLNYSSAQTAGNLGDVRIGESFSAFPTNWGFFSAGATSQTYNVTLQAGSHVLRVNFFPSGTNTVTVTGLTFENAQSPFGTVTTVQPAGTTTIQAASYDNGGANVAYYDTTTANETGSGYRSPEQVDANTTLIGYINSGEWVEYSFDVAATGTYDIVFSTMNGTGSTRSFAVDIGDGNLFSQIGTVVVAASGGTAVDSIPIRALLKSGRNVMKLRFTTSGFGLYLTKFTNVQQPLTGTPTAIAGTGTTTLQMGYYDKGGEGVAYHDSDTVNSVSNWRAPGGSYNELTGVDGNYDQLAYIGVGEWVEYTVNVAVAGVYNFRIKTSNTAGSFVLKTGVGGIDFPTTLATISFPAVPSGTVFTPYYPITLSAGVQTLRFEFPSSGFGLYSAEFTYLHALEAESAGANTSAPALTLQQAAPIFAEAKRRWQNLGVKASAFNGVTFSIADLPNNTLGVTNGNSIIIDSNAANWGWFIDPTPGNDREFTLAGNQGEQNRMDLLTTVTHELGHVLGLEHTENGVMEETLSAGERDMPSASDFASVTSGGGTSTVRRTHAISETASPVAATSPVGTFRRPWWWG